MYHAPSTILNHEAVKECLDGFNEGFDYKYDVYLKEGWAFSEGRMDGSREGRFHSVKEFLYAKPIKGYSSKWHY